MHDNVNNLINTAIEIINDNTFWDGQYDAVAQDKPLNFTKMLLLLEYPNQTINTVYFSSPTQPTNSAECELFHQPR